MLREQFALVCLGLLTAFEERPVDEPPRQRLSTNRLSLLVLITTLGIALTAHDEEKRESSLREAVYEIIRGLPPGS